LIYANSRVFEQSAYDILSTLCVSMGYIRLIALDYDVGRNGEQFVDIVVQFMSEYSNTICMS